MKSNSMITKAACLMLMASATTSAFAQKMNIEHKGDTTIIKVENPTKYLLLPIQEEKDEAPVCKPFPQREKLPFSVFCFDIIIFIF